MRTLSEIVESARDGQMPTHEECYWAMLALNALSTFDGMDLSKMAQAEKDGKKCFAMMRFEGRFGRSKRAWAQDPKEWTGWDNDPANPEFLKRRNTAKRIVEHCVNKVPNAKPSEWDNQGQDKP